LLFYSSHPDCLKRRAEFCDASPDAGLAVGRASVTTHIVVIVSVLTKKRSVFFAGTEEFE